MRLAVTRPSCSGYGTLLAQSSALHLHLRFAASLGGGGGFSKSKLAHPVGPLEPSGSSHIPPEGGNDNAKGTDQETMGANRQSPSPSSQHAEAGTQQGPPPPRPVKRGKEAFMLELEKAERAEQQARKEKPNAAFIAKLSKIEEDSAQHASSTGFFAKGSAFRKEKKKLAMASERKAALVFRDVGMELDRAILSRDILLIPKYFYYGIEFAIDNELERMLRYFNEHAINEMKLINDGKLMRGPERLAKTGFLFPSIEGVTKLATIMPHSFVNGEPPSAADNSGGNAATTASVVPVYNDPKAKTTLACGSFRKPTLVIFSQLGQRVGGQADRMWREIALSYVAPTFAEQLTPKMKIDLGTAGGNPSSTSVGEAAHAAVKGGAKGSSVDLDGLLQSKPLAVLSMRSLDVQNYKWVHRLYVRRFMQALTSNTYDTAITTSTSSSSSSAIPERAPPAPEVLRAYNRWLAASTVIGSGVLKPFFKEGLRNYLSPYAMLVDHRGNVRWVAGGLPDAKEKAILPKLFQQLGVEYYRDRSSASASASTTRSP